MTKAGCQKLMNKKGLTRQTHEDVSLIRVD